MPLKVRTSNGKVFHRCGMRFDKTWTIVEDNKLDQLFAVPGPAKKGKHPTVRQILINDDMLICMEDDSPKRSKPNGSDKGGGKNGGDSKPDPKNDAGKDKGK